MVELFAGAGANVVTCSRTLADVEEVADSVAASDRPGDVRAVEADVTDRDEVADLVCFLASDAGSFVTGESVEITGSPLVYGEGVVGV